MEHEMTTQREKIVDHVWQMIITMGIKAVRMDDVANVMGMSKRTLYEMFGDKEDRSVRSTRCSATRRSCFTRV